MDDKIVISGIGLISPLGHSIDEFWRGLINAEDGIEAISNLNHFQDGGRQAGQVTNFKAKEFIKRPVLKPLDMTTRFCIAGVAKALQDAGLEINDENRQQTAIIAGSMYQGIGCIFNFKKACYENGLTHLSPLFFPGIVFNSLSGQAAIEHKIEGPNSTIGNGVNSGLSAVTKAVEYIRSGKATTVIAGGAEMLHDFIFYKYDRLNMLASAKKGAEKALPFDTRREGFILGEGACFFTIEKESAARTRGATVYGVIDNYSSVYCPAQDTEAKAEALANCMKKSSEQTDGHDKVDAIVCDASGCPETDAIEAEAIHKLHGDDGPLLTANKANIGHALGASGAFNLCQGLLGLVKNQVPPIKNLENPEKNLNYVRETVSAEFDRVLINSVDFNNNYLSICVSKA